MANSKYEVVVYEITCGKKSLREEVHLHADGKDVARFADSDRALAVAREICGAANSQPRLSYVCKRLLDLWSKGMISPNADIVSELRQALNQ